MSRSKLFFCALLFLTPLSQLQAQQLTTFTDGQPARAAEVNANFTALVAEINTLKAQVAALQAQAGGASIVGTWDVYNMDGTTFGSGPGSMDMENVGGTGTLVVNSNGTFALTQDAFKSSLHITNQASAACSTNCTIKSLIVGTAFNGPDSDGTETENGTYTVSGSTVTISVDGHSGTLRVTKDGNMMFLFQADASGIQLMIFSKR